MPYLPAPPQPHPHRRLLSKSRLSAADEPPAEEADEASDDNNDGHRYARDRAGREAAPVRAGGRAARPICTWSVPRDTLCACASIVCARLAVLWRALFAIAISLSVSISADLTDIIGTACGAVRDGARYTLRSINAGLLRIATSEALERG